MGAGWQTLFAPSSQSLKRLDKFATGTSQLAIINLLQNWLFSTAIFSASCNASRFSCNYQVCTFSIPDNGKKPQSRVLSIYDNTQIPSIGTDLLGIRFGIFAGTADEPGGGCNCRVRFCGGFGNT